MEYVAWKAAVESTAGALHTAWSGPSSEHSAHAREALAALSALFLDAPAEVDAAFRDLEEDDLKKETAVWVRRFGQGRFTLKLSRRPNEGTRKAAGYVRALDRDLVETLSPHLGPPADPESAYRTASGAAYVVPRPVTRLGRRPQPFSKRGLLAHRVLPCEVAGLRVRITLHRSRRRSLDDAHFGAALFTTFTLRIATPGQHFHLTDIDCADQRGQIKGQIDRACRPPGCAVLAWPELMMPPWAREHLAHVLSQIAMESPAATAPDLVVAGSWHEPHADGTLTNVGTAFSGTGKPLAQFTKVNRFYLRDGDDLRGENIAIGHELTVIVTDFGAVSICICKDFCDTTFAALDRLDVDLFVIPSMGGDSTMEGHRAKGNAVKHASGAAIFVVQQHIGTPPDPPHRPVGWALTSAGLGQSLATLSQNTTFKRYR